MRRVLLVAAATLLGSGCIVSNDNGVDGTCGRTITVTWSPTHGFTTGDGVSRSCGDPSVGVAFVDIYMNGVIVDPKGWNCTDGGAIITQVASGSYVITVNGVQPAQGTSPERIAFRDEFTVDATTCGDHLVQAQPAEGYVDLNPNCLGGTLLWFSVQDQVANQEVVRVDGSTTPTDFVCGARTANLFPLPAGPHRLNWIEEVTTPTPTTFAVTGSHCGPTDFTVSGGATNTVGVSLSDVPPAGVCQ
jgi:hypothetical protein